MADFTPLTGTDPQKEPNVLPEASVEKPNVIFAEEPNVDTARIPKNAYQARTIDHSK